MKEKVVITSQLDLQSDHFIKPLGNGTLLRHFNLVLILQRNLCDLRATTTRTTQLQILSIKFIFCQIN